VKWISTVNFKNNKAKYIKKATQMIRDDFNDIVPDNLKDLKKLPGVGNKMAHLLLQAVWGKVVGVSVDTHVHRVSNRLQWAGKEVDGEWKKATIPDYTSRDLMEWLP
jgi:endonuclease III